MQVKEFDRLLWALIGMADIPRSLDENTQEMMREDALRLREELAFEYHKMCAVALAAEYMIPHTEYMWAEADQHIDGRNPQPYVLVQGRPQ